MSFDNSINKCAQHALAADGSTGGEKSCHQSRFPHKPAQKSRIIQAYMAPAMLGAPEALAVGPFTKLDIKYNLDTR
jgi:hypothetical protein